MSIVRTAFVLLLSFFSVLSLSAQPLPLAFKPLAVQYSKSLDRLVMVSANPNQVHLINPVSGTETTINLSLPPLSLSVSPDGTHAAVGHDGWISYVNLSPGYVEKNLAVSTTANVLVLAGNGNIWVSPSITVNIATGVQTSVYNFWDAIKPALHPNGKWIYYTRSGSPDDVIKGDISSGSFQYLYDSKYHGDFPVCAGIFYSADGNRLLTGCGTLFRTTESSTDDITYNGSLSAAPLVTAAADSTITGKFAIIPGSRYYDPAPTDTEVQFYDNEYLTLLGRVGLPKYTSGSGTVPWHGRYVFYSPDASRLYFVLQADASANLVYDYAIYSLTLSTGSGCGAMLGANSRNLPAAGGSVDVTVTATAGCIWQASSNATWLSVGAGGVSSGSGAVTIQAGPNLQTVPRSGTVTIAGLTYTVTQDAAAAPGTNPVTASPVRPVAAEYSTALDRMILVSTNPDLLTIFDPVTGNGQTVQLVMPPTALSISPDGLHAAVGHDGRISYVNLAVPVVEKTFPVTTTVYSLALGAADIYAFPLRDQWESIHTVNIATGTETLWNSIYAGSTAGKISPDGKYLYINASKRYDIKKDLWSEYDSFVNSPRQWFSQDGSRLFSGSGQAFRLSDVASQDLQYNGTLESGGLTAVADSSVQKVTATVAGLTNDTTIKFFGQQYLAAIGSMSIPKFTVGSNSYDAHGRYLFWNTAGNRLFALVQADQISGLLNDFAIYTVSLNGGCNTSMNGSTASVPDSGGSFSVMVTANAGCAWKATSSASWLTISANALSAGPATVSYIVDPNPTTAVRTATITVDGKTLTVTQAAGTQAQLSAVTSLPFRVVDAEYSNALDRIIALSGGPSRLNIYDPATGVNVPVTLPLPGIAVSVAPSGVRAAVCHDGLVSIISLQAATVEKSLPVSGNCYDVVLPDNGYVYVSVAGGWGRSSSVNIATGVETKADLLYNGINFQLNATGDAVYTSNTGTSAASVTRYLIAGGPMKQDYQSEWYPPHPFGSRIWFTRDGRMVGDSGSVFRTGSTLSTDFIYAGTLSGYPGNFGSIATIAHSTTRHLFASVGGAGTYSQNLGTSLALHGDKYLALSSKLTLPKITVGAASASSHGKFVFWDSAGAKAYVILQADATAGLQNDFAVYTLSPEFTPGCAVTLGTNSGTAIAWANTGSIAVNAASDCVWEVKPSASWIQIDTGTLGVGIGNVSYSILANNDTVARTGTITTGTRTFTITQDAATPAAITSPAAGSALSGSSVTFQWEASAGATDYWFSVSSVGPGAYELYNGSQGTSTSRTVTGLPTNGGTIYVRLYSHIGANYVWRDYTFTAFSSTPVSAAITSPASGSILSGSSVTFQWNIGLGVADYWLSVSSVGPGAYELYNGSQGTSTSRTVTGLPTNGSTIYVRLYSHIGANYVWRDYTFTAFSSTPVSAAITSPASGSTLTGSSATFQWNTGTGVADYWLSVSAAAPGAYELYNGSQGTSTSRTVTGLPTNGSTIYVRLYSHIGGNYVWRDYTFTALSSTPVSAAITTPASGSTLTGSSVTFQWNTGSGVADYWLSVSTTGPGAYELYNGSQGVSTSRTVIGLPTNGSTIYVRLYSHIGANYVWRDYTFTAYSSTPVSAAITGPSGYTLSGSSVTFQWNTGAGVADYWLSVSSVGPGAYELYNGSQGTSTSRTVTGLPTNGSTIYVRLYSHIGANYVWRDYIFIAASAH